MFEQYTRKQKETRRKVIEYASRLAELADENGEENASIVLRVLVGAMKTDEISEEQLTEVCADFARQEIERLECDDSPNPYRFSHQ
jgi:hypothetical protein